MTPTPNFPSRLGSCGDINKPRSNSMSSARKFREMYGSGSKKRSGGGKSAQKLREMYTKSNAGITASSTRRDGGKKEHGHSKENLNTNNVTNGHTTGQTPRFYLGSSRQFSTDSNDSLESDGGLCTEGRCVMDSLRSKSADPVQKSLDDGGTSLRQRLRKWSGSKLTSGKLCKSCGGEMQAEVSAQTAVNERGNLLSTKRLRRRLSGLVPNWMTEPEYMVHPKPRLNKSIIHSHADSLFSTSSGFTNYYGILNLGLILLVLGNARLFLENIIKYGILINLSFTQWFFNEPYNWPNVILTLSLGVYPAIALLTEKALAKDYISNQVGCGIYIVNVTVLITLPAAVIYYYHPVMVFSLITLGSVTICSLKLVSYGHTNYWCRETMNQPHRRKRRRSVGESPDGTVNNHVKEGQVYPDNLNVKDMAYFMFAPTLCYELNFPRSARIRKRFLLKRVLEMIFLAWLDVALLQQWIVPAVNNARQPLAEMEIFKMLERLLKLSIPNHLIWLVFFYCFFHSTLNVLAELLRFGDREFYRDWWNAEAVAEFWSNWNIPVHRFCARHVYKPLLRRGTSKLAASTFVFCLSAFFHEYLVSVPLRMFKLWAFMGMLMQVPIAYITGKYIKGKWGNIVMWLSLILGQPVAILAYFHDYYIVHSLPLHNATMPTPPLGVNYR